MAADDTSIMNQQQVLELRKQNVAGGGVLMCL